MYSILTVSFEHITAVYAVGDIRIFTLCNAALRHEITVALVGNITVTAVAAALGVLFVFRQRMKLDAHSLSKLRHSITYLVFMPCRARIEYAVIH